MNLKLNKCSWLSCLFFIITAIIFYPFIQTQAEGINFSSAEKKYIQEKKVLRAVSLDGVAPLHFTNRKGEVVGIDKEILDELAKQTGLTIEFYLYPSLDDIKETIINENQMFDLFTGVSGAYPMEGGLLSTPYLKTETILYYNKNVDPSELDQLVYAAISGAKLPEGIQFQNARYYESREESLNAVEKGEADYGYGNTYSVSFYTLQNEYTNIVTVPKAIEERSYVMGIANQDRMLLSIVNKVLATITDRKIEAMILNISSKVERKVTFPVILQNYHQEITLLVLGLTTILCYFVWMIYRSKVHLETENKKYTVISELSNEHFFQYRVRDEQIEISANFQEVMNTKNLVKLERLLKEILLNEINGQQEKVPITINFDTEDEEQRYYRVISAFIREDADRIVSIVGKLSDITREEHEKEELRYLAQVDGLTGVYNAKTARMLIEQQMKKNPANQLSAFLLIDSDRFKLINDTHGHLEGDSVLRIIGKEIQKITSENAIFGRIGGDEFCAYLPKISNKTQILEKVQRLIDQVENKIYQECGIYSTISIGIAIIEHFESYEVHFAEADKAMYDAKARGGGRWVAHQANDGNYSE